MINNETEGMEAALERKMGMVILHKTEGSDERWEWAGELDTIGIDNKKDGWCL